MVPCVSHGIAVFFAPDLPPFALGGRFPAILHLWAVCGIDWGQERDMGFDENWFLFLLIVMAVFASDGKVSSTETAVMLSVLFALTVAGPTLVPRDADSEERSSAGADGCR